MVVVVLDVRWLRQNDAAPAVIFVKCILNICTCSFQAVYCGPRTHRHTDSQTKAKSTKKKKKNQKKLRIHSSSWFSLLALGSNGNHQSHCYLARQETLEKPNQRKIVWTQKKRKNNNRRAQNEGKNENK